MKSSKTRTAWRRARSYNIGIEQTSRSANSQQIMKPRQISGVPESAKSVQLVETSSGAYYGAAYQDVQTGAENRQHDPGLAGNGRDHDDALRKIFKRYRAMWALHDVLSKISLRRRVARIVLKSTSIPCAARAKRAESRAPARQIPRPRHVLVQSRTRSTGWPYAPCSPGFLKKVSRTSVVEHYGVKTLMYACCFRGGYRPPCRCRDARDP